MHTDSTGGTDFVRTIINEDVRTGRHDGRVATRFPPEPNGYLHIGHAKAICLNFDLAQEYRGTCNLRFDDTNPETEDMKYVTAIQDDVRWLGFSWDNLFFASDYFDQLYAFAEKLIRDGSAYVDSLSESEIREYRGTVTESGKASPYRERSVDENLDLFRRMRAGEFPNGAHVLRAKIDMASPNMVMRDPILYRIRHASHYRTGDEWCIYPLYDFTHCLSDAVERITHSLCSLEFKDNRELYDWVVEHVGFEAPPHQYEFARLNLDYTVLSKRKLIALVRGGHVSGWDDPRMPTIAGLRRRGVTPEAIRSFCDMIGVARVDSRVDIGKLEYAIRDDLNRRVPRVLAVLDPLRVVITNYPDGQVEELDAPLYPHDVPKEGSRPVPFSKELYIERTDFMEDPPKGFFRLAPGREVRLRYAYVITCDEVVRDPDSGAVVELRCSYDPATRGGNTPDGRKVKGTIQWVSAEHALEADVRLYDRLFRAPDPDDVGEDEDFTANLNPDSLMVVQGALVEPSIGDDAPGTRYQFERLGYFVSDSEESRPDRLVFNRTVTLRDTWAKITGRAAGESSEPAPPAPDRSPTPHERKDESERRRQWRPELMALRDRYVSEFGVPEAQADVLASDGEVARFFEEAAAASGDVRAVANWTANDVLREAKGRSVRELPFDGAALAALVDLVVDGTVSSSMGRAVLARMAETGGVPRDIVDELGGAQLSDVAHLESLVDGVLESHPDRVDAYREGKTGLLGFFMGQVMRETKGRANPQLVTELLERKLG